MKHVAIYYRVSSNQQKFRSQQPDLKRWKDNHDGTVKIYKDKQSGKTMDRPGWNKLQDAINTGKVDTVGVIFLRKPPALPEDWQNLIIP